MRRVRNFTIVFGTVSTLFDMLTFAALIYLGNGMPEQFRAGWFLESLATEVLVLFVIRTPGRIFRQQAGAAMIWSSVLVMITAIVVLQNPVGRLIGFVPLPLSTLAVLAGITLAYCGHGGMAEDTAVPARRRQHRRAARGGAQPMSATADSGSGLPSRHSAWPPATASCRSCRCWACSRFPGTRSSSSASPIGIPVPFVLAMVALHHTVPEPRRIWTHCALVLAAMYAVLVIIVYPHPAGRRGAAEDGRCRGCGARTCGQLRTFIWVIDGAGYVLMGPRDTVRRRRLRGRPPARWLRRLLIANGLIDPLIIAVYVWPWLLPLGGLWIITAPGSLWLLARYFRHSAGQA